QAAVMVPPPAPVQLVCCAPGGDVARQNALHIQLLCQDAGYELRTTETVSSLTPCTVFTAQYFPCTLYPRIVTNALHSAGTWRLPTGKQGMALAVPPKPLMAKKHRCPLLRLL